MMDRRLSTVLRAGLASLLAVMSLAATAAAAEKEPATKSLPPTATKQVDYLRDVEPLFAAKCYDCHGADAHEGQLRLDAKAIVFHGGQSGPMIKAGDSANSLLVHRLVGIGDEPQMPLEMDPFTDQEIGLVRAWIDQGAKWPEGFGVDVRTLEKHWAYVPPVRPELPEVKNTAWAKNPIDRFVLAKLEQEGMAPSPPALRERLIRRVYFDLIGLPPSVAEVDAFVRDESPDAYEKVVDRLLASPKYGERWAVPWLDGARYADSNGFQRDGHRSAWAYRDWVINALNRDMPFDQFTIEQVAGDLLPNATLEQKIATGFNRGSTVNVEAGVDPEENRVNQVIDRVNVTSTIWLGTTVECTQCHNHKYDPFTQKEFYQLFAYFNNTAMETEREGSAKLNFIGPELELPLPKEMQAQQRQLENRYQSLAAELENCTAEAESELSTWEKSTAEALKTPPQWQRLEIAKFVSKEGASHEILDDGSVLITESLPDKDTYTLTVNTKLEGITAFRLEALTDPSLPSEGPGRNPGRPNFVLNEFTVTAKPQGPSKSAPVSVSFSAAVADFSQKDWAIAGAIDGNPTTGWGIAPKFGAPHQATFLAKKSVGFPQGTTLSFKLVQQTGRSYTIGRLRLSALTSEGSLAILPESIVKIIGTPGAERTEEQQKAIREYYLSVAPNLQQMRESMAEVQKQLGQIKPPASLVMSEMDEPRMTNIFQRGNFLTKGDEVKPGTPRVLHPLPKDAPPNRLGLARWLVDPQNPLIGRVTVNRWWADFFGTGIVATEEDFGSQSEPATHPELLDWLAVEFIEHGWSTKHIHKLIAMSATYQQTSQVTRELLAKDPYNKLVTRGPRIRLDAELVRDNALAVSGMLSEKMGGPPVRPPQPDGIWRVTGQVDNTYRTATDEDRYRRGLYTVWRRSAPYPSFVNFDAPDRSACVVKRTRSNTPLQALTLMNDQAYVELAAAFATRIMREAPEASVEGRITFGLRLCVARPPKATELEPLVKLYQEELARYRADPEAAAKLIKSWNLPQLTENHDPAELAAWFCVTNVLLNLDETITKG